MTAAKSVYVDTSALGALLIERPETARLVEWLDSTEAELFSSDLLETELRRLAVREEIDQQVVSKILEGVSLATLDRAVYRSAGLLPMKFLRTLDAIHLEAAIRLNADGMLTYDRRLTDACTELGIEVISPGQY